MAETLNCRCCGGVLDVKGSLCVCKFCGATNFISPVASKNINQLNRANKLRQEREFDNAARIYDVILVENDPTADILWYRTLCEYGIEYVPDPVSDKYFPTLHRIKDESIFNCKYFNQALELAEGTQKETLLKEAKYIDEVQRKYLNIAANEDPYDVFICYKETDLDTGEKTEDVELAEELYNELTLKGYKVFFARETLKEKLSIDFEPYIFAALKSSKAMAVIGTRAEYFTSVWVKNEWGRFLRLMDKNPEKQIFFACNDPEELPRAFAAKQAQLLGKPNAIKNLADNIDNFLNRNNASETTQPPRNIYQEEFDKIIETKTREFVKDFRMSDTGKLRKEALDDIEKNADVVDYYNNKDRLTFALGILIYLSAFVFMILLLFIFSYTWLDDWDSYVLATLLSLPLIIAGTAVLLSYNWVLDLITISFMMVVLLISTFGRSEFTNFLTLLAVYAPIAVYSITSQVADSFNKFKHRRSKASLEVKKGLEDIKEISNMASTELTEAASNLLRQYKEKNGTLSGIKIKDDDYFKALENFNYMYESAERKYKKYVDVSDSEARKSPEKEESIFGTTILASFLIAPFTLITYIGAVLDIVLDQYRERRHRYAIWVLSLYLIVILGGITIFICTMRW